MSVGSESPRVVFLIQSLGVGGAEAQLVHLATGLEDHGFRVSVIAMRAGGPLEMQLQKRDGFDYAMLGKRGRADVVGFGAKLVREIRRRRPAILHGFMPVANQLASVVGPLTGAKVVWGIRAAFVDFRHYDAASRILFQTGRMLSSQPDLIIANSTAGRDYHRSQGYNASRMIVIPNGIDHERFAPRPEVKQRMREEWGIPAGVPVVGIVGRLEAMKGHATFLRAAGIVASTSPAHFVCIGGGPPAFRGELEAIAKEAGCADRVHWPGVCADMPAAYAALDVLVSASLGEGFSNVVGEAMACDVRCVVTDAGDSAAIVGDTGIVVPIGDSEVMAAGISRLLAARSAGRGSPRERIITHFSRERMVATTAAALRGVL